MANTLTGTVIAEKYRLGDLLRSGGQSDLYEARHVLMDKPVAIRVLRPSLAMDSANSESFFAAAKTASQISSPYILAVNDFGTDREGFRYAVFEPLAGKSLKEVIAEDGTFPAHSAVEVARQTAEALTASHAADRIHGNLTTENVILTGSDGVAVKVVDFGSSNALLAERTEPADFAYLAPEQCSGSDTPDERGDIYSLGIILYEMLAGIPPFTGEKPSDVMVKHIDEPPAPLSAYHSGLPETLEPVIAKALSKNPEMRQQSAAEFYEELASVSCDLAAQSVAAPQNNLWKTAFVVLVGMSLLAAFLIYGTYVRRTDPATALQPDANGLPVQPINPATGAEEQTLAAMPSLTADGIANSNLSQQPGTLPGGDGYNPWGTGAPPPGAPYIPPGGQVVTIDPATGSPFMPPDGGVVLVPVPVNTNTAKPTSTPKTPANANTAPQTTPTPKVNPSPAKPTPTPAARPARTPAARPKTVGENDGN